MSGASRASIPTSVKKTIQDLKEIARNHSDDEIYAMLKECSMDPNEAAQKLLFQDTFHLVKRKREKRKENIKEVSDARWRQATHGRGGRSGRGNYTPRYTSHDTDTKRINGVEKENGFNEGGWKGSTSTLSTTPLVTEDKASTGEHILTIPLSSMPNGPIKSEHLSSGKCNLGIGASIEGVSAVTVNKDGAPFNDGKLSSSSSSKSSSSTSITYSSGIYASSSDPILLPSLDGHTPGSVGAIKREIRIPRSVVDTTVGRGVSHNIRGSELSPFHKTAVSEKSDTYVNGKNQGNFQEIEGGHVPDTNQTASPSSSITGTSGSRPSSNYSNRSQNPSASIKAGSGKEWKPKSTIVNPATSSGVLSTSVVDFQLGEAVNSSIPVANPLVPDNGTKIQKKLEELHISDTKHVIIPDHLQVSESERSRLSFGSFDSNFTLNMPLKNESDIVESPAELSESSEEEAEENVEFPTSSIDCSKVAEENNYETDQQPSVPGNQSEELDIPSCISPPTENNQLNFEASSTSIQPSVIHTAPVYPNFGLVPPILGSHFTTFDGADPQAHETARVPSFIVPQPFDPSANYYASMYRPAIDGDGRFSPLHAHGAATKYNGTIASLSTQNGQSTQESGSSLVLCSTGSTPLVPQAAGVVQTSIATGQQPVPIFRQPAGVHISPYPPNYVHYSQYFSPFYVPPPTAIHHFLGNAATFHQQPPTGSIFPLPTANVGANSAKYSISQYKPGTNSGPPGQGAYGLNPVVYSPAALSGGNSAGNEDLASSQFKENNVFINGQQSEGSAVWMSPVARDISSFQAGSFYNVPPQGQPLTFAPTQAGHGTAAFPGIYHPTQALSAGSVHPLLQQSQTLGGAAEIGGAPVGVYQQPHRASQINWVNNY